MARTLVGVLECAKRFMGRSNSRDSTTSIHPLAFHPATAHAQRRKGEVMHAEQIDKIVCEWSIRNSVLMTECALNDLVDTLAAAIVEIPTPGAGEK